MFILHINKTHCNFNASLKAAVVAGRTWAKKRTLKLARSHCITSSTSLTLEHLLNEWSLCCCNQNFWARHQQSVVVFLCENKPQTSSPWATMASNIFSAQQKNLGPVIEHFFSSLFYCCHRVSCRTCLRRQTESMMRRSSKSIHRQLWVVHFFFIVWFSRLNDEDKRHLFIMLKIKSF